MQSCNIKNATTMYALIRVQTGMKVYLRDRGATSRITRRDFLAAAVHRRHSRRKQVNRKKREHGVLNPD